jgi:curved DNA-binding protein CbpA
MKNYYRILGVKKDASEEEIREHWVELMRRLHPDQRMAGTAEDERIKEINEAYQVLKHSSTRVEYDLKRAYDRRKRNSYLRRLSIPIAIFVVLVMIGTLYLRKSQITLQASLPTQDRINPIDQPNQNPVISNQRAEISYQTNQTDQRNQRDQRDQRDQENQIAQKKDPNGLSGSADQRIEVTTQKRINPSTPRRNDATMPKLDEASKPTTQLPNNLMTKLPNDSITQLPNDPTPQRLNDLTASIKEKNQINQTDPTNQIDQRNQINEVNQRDQINQINQNDAPTHQPTPTLTHPPTVVSTHPRVDASARLIATEEEVRGFFANYTERYTQKDLDSFISLFSSRAVQNRKEGLEGIRKIYDNFLKQSQEIKYHMDNISVEIYQNGVEVKARYELVQMMKKSGDKRVWRGDIRWSLIKEDGALKILSLDYQHQKSP